MIDSPTQPSPRTWYTSIHFRRTAWILFVIVLGVWFYNGVVRKHNDFRGHYMLGRGFVEGKPYLLGDRDDPFFSNYPPGRLMLNAPLGLLPYRVARGVSWAAAVGLLLLSLRLWQGMADRRRFAEPKTAFAAAALAMGLTLPWFTRDLDDAGLQLLLLAMLTAAAWWTAKRRAVLAGLMLALAATWKVTPMLFLPLMLYKRRWREAAWMVVFVVILNFPLPMLRLGWDKTVRANGVFFARAQRVMQAARVHPTANGQEPPKHQNRSLQYAIVRYLLTVGPDDEYGHELFIPHPDDVTKGQPIPADARPHPAFVQFLDLDESTVELIVTGLIGALGLTLAIRFRRRWPDRPDKPDPPGRADLPIEWAAVMMLSALLSPLCWGQHLVLSIPAALLIVRDALQRRWPLWRKVALGVTAVCILVPQKEVFGKTLWTVVHSYRPQTLAVLLLLLMVLTIPRPAREAPNQGDAQATA